MCYDHNGGNSLGFPLLTTAPFLLNIIMNTVCLPAVERPVVQCHDVMIGEYQCRG